MMEQIIALVKPDIMMMEPKIMLANYATIAALLAPMDPLQTNALPVLLRINFLD